MKIRPAPIGSTPHPTLVAFFSPEDLWMHRGDIYGFLNTEPMVEIDGQIMPMRVSRCARPGEILIVDAEILGVLEEMREL